MARRIGTPFEEGNKAAEKWTEETIQELINELFEWFETDQINNIFLKDFFVIHKGYYSSIVSYLSEKSKAFSKAIERAYDYQEIRLSKNGLLNKYNPGITRLMLAAHHGIREDEGKEEGKEKDPLDLTKCTPEELAVLAKFGLLE